MEAGDKKMLFIVPDRRDNPFWDTAPTAQILQKINPGHQLKISHAKYFYIGIVTTPAFPVVESRNDPRTSPVDVPGILTAVRSRVYQNPPGKR
jgi:hypothetical protein